MKKLIIIIFSLIILTGCNQCDPSTEYPPGTPSGLNIITSGDKRILTWNNVTREEGFTIRLEKSGSEIKKEDTSVNETSFSLGILETGNYEAFVCAYNVYGTSDWASIEFSVSEVEEIKELTTNESGIVTFTDNQTMEEVNVYIENKTQDKLSEINVTFWDGEGYEMFIVNDPAGQYFSAFEIYEHNSDHIITMYIVGDPLSDTIENIEIGSSKEQAIEKFIEKNKDKSIYMGKLTPEEIDKVTTTKLNIMTPLVGGCYKKFASFLSDFADIVKEIFVINEPEFYDVYILIPGGITSTIRWLEPIEEVTTIPNAPSDFIAMPIDPYSAQVEWQDNSDNEDGFRLEVWGPISDEWKWIGINVTWTSGYWNFPIGGQEWQLRVCSFNEMGRSDWINTTVICPTF